MYKLFDKTVIYYLLFVFIFTENSNKILIYSNFFVLLLFTILNVIRNGKIKYDKTILSFLPLTLLLCWIYGVFVGLINLNNFVFINNVGIVFFLSYYFLNTFNLNLEDYVKILLNTSLISFFAYLYSISSIFNYTFVTNFLVGKRIAYNIFGIFPFLVYPILIYNIFFNKEKYLIIKNVCINYLIFILLSIIAVVFVASKGIYLFIIFVFIILLATHFKNIKRQLIGALFLVSIFFYNILSGLTIFGLEDQSNENRYKQFDAVVSELSIFGKGWGATFISSDLDRDDAGYSIELSYLNLVHKIGFFALFFFLFYMYMFYLIFKYLFKNDVHLKKSALLSLGLSCYLFISIGNPTLFAPIFVFLNCILLIILKQANAYEKG